MIITKHGNKLKTFICDECDCEWKLSPMDIKEQNYYAVLHNEWDYNNFEKSHEYCWAIKCPECGHIRIRYEKKQFGINLIICQKNTMNITSTKIKHCNIIINCLLTFNIVYNII